MSNVNCHLCGAKEIEDCGIFEEPICSNCWEINKENFYEQFCNTLHASVKSPTFVSGFSKEGVDELLEKIRLKGVI